MAPSLMLEDLLKKVQEKQKKANFDLIKQAFIFAKKAHRNQKRLSGESFITHPLTVAFYLAELGLDDKTIIAALLHDVLEDTKTTLEEIKEKFGSKVAQLVDGVTKLKGIRYYGEKKQLEDLRKMFIAMAQDVRVVLIRLADRLHNLRTIKFLPNEKKERIARQTIEIYAPLADRLGIGQWRGELEDLAFPYYLSREYKWTKSLLSEDFKKRHLYIKNIISYLKSLLKREGIKFINIDGRVKHLFSLYKKLLRYDKDISKIYDLEAVRIIVPTVEDCYKSLGIIHKHFKPLLGRIKDYISMPKPNGYQALHTTVFALEGKILEIQIKTLKMHKEAEWGIASHFLYAEEKESLKTEEERVKWVSQLVGWQKEISNLDEFSEILKKDIFENRIYVFTPKGDIKELPEKASPVDFAYEVHTEIGNRCIGAKVNGKIVPLHTPLNNGDIVEILVSKRLRGPSHDWLTFVKTKKAQSKIRSWFRKQNREKNLEMGKKILKDFLKNFFKKNLEDISLEQLRKAALELKYKEVDDLFVGLGEGCLIPSRLVKELGLGKEFQVPVKRKIKVKKQDILIEGEGDILYKIASCCRPQSGELIVGYLLQGGGITVHKKNCKNISKKSKDKILKATWASTEISEVAIEILALDRIGLIKDVGGVASDLKINLKEVISRVQDDGTIIIRAVLEISSLSELESFFRNVANIKGILKISRVFR